MSSSTATSDTNVVVVRGVVGGEPVSRSLPSGSTVIQFDLVTVVEIDGRVGKVLVPLAWTDPPAGELRAIVPGERVVAIGSVRRRFFRVAGATQSRTEVVVSRVIPERRTRSVRSALAGAVARVEI